MTKVNILVGFAVMLCSCAVLLKGADTQIGRVSGPRALKKAADVLAMKYGVQINYEDPIYQNSSDFAAAGTVAGTQQADFGNFRLREGTIDVPLMPRQAAFHQPDQVKALLQSAALDYSAKNLPGTFDVTAQDGVLSVIPASVKGRSGTLVASHSPLDTLITLPEKERSGYELVKDLCQQISSTNAKVNVGFVPTTALGLTKTTVSSNHEAARTVLQRALGSLQWKDETVAASGVKVPKMEWRLLYDAEVKYYLLNLIVVKEEVPTPQGNTMVRPLE